MNHADMGNYEEANAEFLDHKTATPDIIATREQGRHSTVWPELRAEIAPQVSVFGRLGWSDGHNESFAFTEDDRTAEFGGFAMGLWRAARATVPGVLLWPMALWPRISSILPWAGWAFCWATAGSPTTRKKSWRASTQHTFGAASPSPTIFSTSTIPGITRRADLYRFPRSGSTQTFDKTGNKGTRRTSQRTYRCVFAALPAPISTIDRCAKGE